MSKSFVELEDTIAEDERIDEWPLTKVLRDVLEWLDKHRDQLPGRTITESELIAAVDETNHEDMNEYQKAYALLIHLGYAIPTPKPTNAERWREFLSERLSVELKPWQLGYLVEAMVESGVKAPGVDK